MTLSVGPTAATLILLLGALAVRRTADARAARAAATRLMTTVLTLVVLLSAAAAITHRTQLDLLPSAPARWALAASCLAGLAAVALAPVTAHPPRTLARVLVVIALGTATTAAGEPAAAVLLWALSAATVYGDLRERHGARGPARLFAVHQGLGVALGAAGALLLLVAGHTATSTTGTLESAGSTALLLAAALRMGLMPLHLWLARLVDAAPPGLAVAFLASPTALMLLPADGPPALRDGYLAAAAVTAVLGSGLGLVQRHARGGLAFVLISQAGMVSTGVAAGTPIATAGGVLFWQAGVLALSAALMVLAAAEARRGPVTDTGPGGSLARTPRLAGAFLLLGLAAVGFPATLGFVAEDLLLEGTRPPALAVALAVATAANGATVMRWFFRGFTGRGDHDGEPDLTPREMWAVTAALAAVLLGAVVPGDLVAVHGAVTTQARNA
jgi:NADH:ubiquinone oxidoreductase subunit 2 (subunit N)